MIKKYHEMLDTKTTLAEELFDKVNHPWEVLSQLSEFIKGKFTSLSDEYILYDTDVYVHSSAVISHSACIKGPCIIGKNTEIRHYAYIRGNVLIGDNCVVGNSSEIKNAILFNGVNAPHFNYIGDAILGKNAHIGAGVILSNMKSDKSNIVVKDFENIDTKLRKFSAVLGDNVEVGCNSVLCPGTIVGQNTSIYPLSMIRGVIAANAIYKSQNNIIKKEV